MDNTDETTPATETDMVTYLQELLFDADEGLDAVTFDDAGVLTYNKGLVVRTADGAEYQITVVKSR